MPIDPEDLTLRHITDDPDKMVLSHKRVSDLAKMIRELRDENGDKFSMPELVNACGMLVYALGQDDGARQ